MALEETPAAKYLGVTIDSKLKWKEQYAATTKKSNNVLAFLRRNIHDCPMSVKEVCYKTLVRPILDYGSCVWDPHFKVDIDSLEKVQKRAGRFVTGNYTFESGNTKINMQKLGWKPLEERRARIKLNILFKSRMGLIDIPTDPLLTNNFSSRRGVTYAIPASNLNCHQNSYFPSTIRLWNSLPAEAKLSSTSSAFKSHLNSLTLKANF